MTNALIYSLSGATLIGMALLAWLMPLDSAPWEMILLSLMTIGLGLWVYWDDKRVRKINVERVRFMESDYD